MKISNSARSAATALALTAAWAPWTLAQTAGSPPPPTAPASDATKPGSAVTPASKEPPAAAESTQRVEVTGGRVSDTEERRRATAAKIVIGREEIDKFGDANVGEVLRRLPGVTTPGAPGRGGPPRMRGLGGGYTQLLIDGQRIPPGFSMESLTPDQIERIEILRAPTAETGARAIAGTINIITREGYTRRLNDLRVGFGLENGQRTPGIFWTRNDTAGPLIYNLSAGSFFSRRKSSSLTETTDEDLSNGRTVAQQRESSTSWDRRNGLNLTGRLQWRLSESGDSLMLMPTVFHMQGKSTRDFALEQSLGPTPAAYDNGTSGTDSGFTSSRLNAIWRQRLGPGRIEFNGGLGSWRGHSDTERQEFLRSSTTAPVRQLSDVSKSQQDSLNFNAKYTLTAGGNPEGGNEHSLVSGLEGESQRRSETRTSLQAINGGALTPLFSDFGDNLSASSQRVAAFVQDEWSISPQWAAHGGLRWEGITTQGDSLEGAARPKNHSSVATPLLHLVWKPDPKSRDQVRLSLTRSYKSPDLNTLIARPTLNTRYPVSGTNSPTAPDRAGNPDLRPERALGVDMAFERYLENGGLLSANVFARRIHDLNRSVTALETVSWSRFPRWVARQQNVGEALTQGLELEAKFRLDQAIAGALPVDLRSNVSFYRSRVESVPGPDNRLDSQAKATANVGADYRIRSVPLTLGGNLNWVPGYRTQLAEDQVSTVSTKRVWDAFALWTFSPAVGLRLLGSNLAPHDYVTTNAITVDTVRETARTQAPSYVNWQLRLELKL